MRAKLTLEGIAAGLWGESVPVKAAYYKVGLLCKHTASSLPVMPAPCFLGAAATNMTQLDPIFFTNFQASVI